MPSFSKSSMSKLVTCEHDLQTLLLEMIKDYDFSIVFGHRTVDQQNALFLKGRRLKSGHDGSKRTDYEIVDRRKVVTFRGFDKLSNHNAYPSKAVDIIPYPIGWSNERKIYELAGFAKATYFRLKREGRIKKDLRFGSDWKNPADPAHIEVA